MITKKIFAYGLIAVIFALAFAACDNGSTSGGGGDPNSSTYTGYDSEGKAYKLVISKAVSGPNNPDNPGTGNRDSRLVNGANDVWADSYPAGERDGFIFKADGAFHMIDDYTDVWAIYETGTWTTSGNNSLTFTGSGGSITYSYTVTSTTLILTDEDGDSETFTKTTATVSGRSAASPSSAGKAGNKAAVGAIRRAVAADLSSPVGSPAHGRAAAAYAPQKGDKFTLTITGAIGGTSTGTVSDSNTSGDTLTLDNDGKEFKAKIKGLFIDEIPDPIPLDDGDTLPAPGTLFPTRPANPGISGDLTWTAVPDRGWVYGIAYGNGRFVAVGEGVACSDDGINWVQVTGGRFQAVAYEGGRFVAGGNDGRVAYSDDGISWIYAKDSTFGQSLIYSVAYGGGKFVAGGDNGKMAYSDDNGVTWTAVTDSTIWQYGESSAGIITAIAYGDGKFVAGGTSGAAYSADGINWTKMGGLLGANAIAYANGRWVAGGLVIRMLYSADGINWTAVSDSTVSSMRDIAYGDGRFIAVGLGGKMAYSNDGQSWTAITNSAFSTSSSISAIAYGSDGNAVNRFVAGGGEMVAGGSGKIWYTGSGGDNPNSDLFGPADWTAVADSAFGDNNNYITAIAYGSNRWVAGGYYGKMAYSSDNGVTWTAVTDSQFGTSHITAIAYGGGNFVAGGSGKMAYSSDNGVTWTAVTLDSTFKYGIFSVNAIAYGGNKFVAGGVGGGMAYSSDGITWTDVTDSTIWQYTSGNSTSTAAIRGIAYGNGRFVAVGNYGIAYSADGINWTKASGGTDLGGYAIAYGSAGNAGNRFAAGPMRQDNVIGMAYSTDGASWTFVPDSNLGFYAAAYGNGRFAAVGDNGKRAYSANGSSWIHVPDSTTSNINAVAYGNGRFVAGGSAGKMAYADW